jgi:Flp pilus assembly protein TadB
MDLAMTPELKLALVAAVAGLLTVGVGYVRWRFQRTRREDWQREMREAAEGLSRATTDDERDIWRKIIEDLERDARADDKGAP